MVNTSKLRGLIAEHNMSQAQVAELLGISNDTFYRKMKSGRFDTDEAYAMIEILHIDNPIEVFFVPTN